MDRNLFNLAVKESKLRTKLQKDIISNALKTILANAETRFAKYGQKELKLSKSAYHLENERNFSTEASENNNNTTVVSNDSKIASIDDSILKNRQTSNLNSSHNQAQKQLNVRVTYRDCNRKIKLISPAIHTEEQVHGLDNDKVATMVSPRNKIITSFPRNVDPYTETKKAVFHNVFKSTKYYKQKLAPLSARSILNAESNGNQLLPLIMKNAVENQMSEQNSSQRLLKSRHEKVIRYVNDPHQSKNSARRLRVQELKNTESSKHSSISSERNSDRAKYLSLFKALKLDKIYDENVKERPLANSTEIFNLTTTENSGFSSFLENLRQKKNQNFENNFTILDSIQHDSSLVLPRIKSKKDINE